MDRSEKDGACDFSREALEARLRGSRFGADAQMFSCYFTRPDTNGPPLCIVCRLPIPSHHREETAGAPPRASSGASSFSGTGNLRQDNAPADSAFHHAAAVGAVVEPADLAATGIATTASAVVPRFPNGLRRGASCDTYVTTGTCVGGFPMLLGILITSIVVTVAGVIGMVVAAVSSKDSLVTVWWTLMGVGSFGMLMAGLLMPIVIERVLTIDNAGSGLPPEQRMVTLTQSRPCCVLCSGKSVTRCRVFDIVSIAVVKDMDGQDILMVRLDEHTTFSIQPNWSWSAEQEAANWRAYFACEF